MVTFLTLRNPPPDSGRAIPLVTSDTRNGLLVVFLPIFAVYVITRVLYGYAPGAFRDMQAVGMDISRAALERGSALRVTSRRTGNGNGCALSVGSR